MTPAEAYDFIRADCRVFVERGGVLRCGLMSYNDGARCAIGVVELLSNMPAHAALGLPNAAATWIAHGFDGHSGVELRPKNRAWHDVGAKLAEEFNPEPAGER